MHMHPFLDLAWVAPNALSALLQRTSPNAAVVAATLGFCLIVVELNRPGTILPGSLGLVLALLAAGALARQPLRPSAMVLLAVGSGILACNLWKRLPAALLVAASLVLAIGLRMLVLRPAFQEVSLPVAGVCGGTVGIAAALLSRVAFRARRLKAVH